MIKFKFDHKDGKPGVGFGLSAENLKRLQVGHPILVDLSEMGVNAEIMIFFGDTEETMIHDLREFIGKGTVIKGYDS